MILRITVLLLFIMVLIKRDLEMKVGTRRNDVGRVEVQLAAALTSAPKRDCDEQDWAMNISISCQRPVP